MEFTEQENRDINSFTFNAKCGESQLNRMAKLREEGMMVCRLICQTVPNSADRSSAIRYLRLAIMQCNVAIAHESYE